MINQIFTTFLSIMASLKAWLEYLKNIKSFIITASSAAIGRSRTQLLNSLIFGSAHPLSNTLHRNFQIMGMLHLLSASGYNVGLVLQIVKPLFKRCSNLSQKTKAILTALSVLLFFYLSNGGYSLQRAVVMALFAIVVRRLWYRQIASLRLLFYACLLIVWLNPEGLQSLSLQLSVAATGGIVWLYPILSRWISMRKDSKKTGFSKLISLIRSYCRQGLLLYLSAQIGVLPILINTFGEISLLGLITNTFLVGIVPFLTVIAVLWLGACGLFLLMDRLNLSILLFVKQYLAVATMACLDLFLTVSDWLGQANSCLWTIKSWPQWLVVTWYGVWFATGYYARKKWIRRSKSKYQLIRQLVKEQQ